MNVPDGVPILGLLMASGGILWGIRSKLVMQQLRVELRAANNRADSAEKEKQAIKGQLEDAGRLAAEEKERNSRAEARTAAHHAEQIAAMTREFNVTISKLHTDLENAAVRITGAETALENARADSTSLFERLQASLLEVGRLTERARTLNEESAYNKWFHAYYKTMCDGLVPIIEGLLAKVIAFDTLLTEAERRQRALEMEVGLKQIRDTLSSAVAMPPRAG